MKRMIALLLCALMLMGTAALAERRVDESGAYTYDYDKSVFDEIIFGNYTYGGFLQSHGNSSYDFDRFVNSEFGEIYAMYANLAVQYRDNMDEGLLAHWREAGMEKTLVHPEGAEDHQQDYYVYTPVDMAEGAQYPLVIVNHGSGANARVCESFGWIELAGREGFMLVMSENVEPEFLHGVLEEVKAAYPVDASRVYMTGTSMGGMASKKFAGLYPDEVAAIAPMNVSFAFIDGEDGDAQALAARGMPMLFVAGTSDVYNPLPVRDAGGSMGSFDGWNALVTMQGFEEYAITPEESAALLDETTDLLEHYTGLRLPEATVHSYVNNRTFQCDFTNDAGVTMLSLVIEENGSHEPLGHDVDFAWDFLKRFARDTETGELIVLS